MATTEDGSFLISPRAAVQAHLEDVVSRGIFAERPAQPGPVMGRHGVGCQRSAWGPSSEDARRTAEHDYSVGSRGVGVAESARGPNCGYARDDAEGRFEGPSGAFGRRDPWRFAHCRPHGGAPPCPTPFWNG